MRRYRQTLSAAALGVLAASITAPAPAGAQDVPLRPERALAWEPPAFDNAELHARIPFLKPERHWERMDIWVPKARPSKAGQTKRPCVVAIYGGGYGDKVGGFVKDFRPLLDRGYVVAAPDYALGSNAPVPLCSWDVANAVRFLRANAAKYGIDPERIGVWGWSAGGWIAQDLCYAGPRRIVTVADRNPKTNKKTYVYLPMLQPHPLYAAHSVRVQAVVSDWGAGKLWHRREKTPAAWLSADDPSLFTCYQGPLSSQTINPVVLLKKLGVPARGVYGMTVNTHVPNLSSTCVKEDGRKTTWGESIYDFLDEALKACSTATAPEMVPHGGPIAAPTDVRLLTVHSTGAVHYTLDGSVPSKASPRYIAPVTVKPGDTLKAIVIRPGLKTSRITAGTFERGPPRPRITTGARLLAARVGKPFSAIFRADKATGATWFAGGMMGERYRSYGGHRFNPPRLIPWMTIDAKTGVLSGTPRVEGVYPVIVSCVNGTATGSRRSAKMSADAVLVVVRVGPDNKEGR